jgi:hypothetical protein
VFDQVFGPQRGRILLGLNTKSGGNQLSFPMPTQAHVFAKRSNGYGRLSTAHVQSSTVTKKLISQRLGGLATVSNGEDFIFYSCLLGLLIK